MDTRKNSDRTSLKEEDLFFINKRDGTVGFLREGTQLVGVGGDDKIYTPHKSSWHAMLALFSHIGITSSLVYEDDTVVHYKLSRNKTLEADTES